MSEEAFLAFDIGRTNRKALVLGDDNRILAEYSSVVEETVDDDGFPCEDLDSLIAWVHDIARKVIGRSEWKITRANFSAHGAAWVLLDKDGNPVAPLYNYMRPFDEELLSEFIQKYGQAEHLTRVTASPLLGHLNAGLQLYWLAHKRPDLFARIHTAVALPQFISFLFTGIPVTEITSIGCHTLMWDFEKNEYAAWVKMEGLDRILPPIRPSTTQMKGSFERAFFTCGVGLHDSSAAIIPSLKNHPSPFTLLSTGTWNITLNPFNHTPLTHDELSHDCLCYMRYDQQPVKAARLMAGPMHDEIVRELETKNGINGFLVNPARYPEVRRAYRKELKQLVNLQAESTRRVMQGTNTLLVEGGFSRNEDFMQLLQEALPSMKCIVSDTPHGAATGVRMILEF